MNSYPNLKQLRLQHNYKQCYVADTLGMSQPEYSKLEAGIRKLDALVIKDLCSLYDISSEHLLLSSISLADNPGVAYIRETIPSTKAVKDFTDQVPHDVMMKMMENYSFLLESYLKQQEMQEKIINKLIDKDIPPSFENPNVKDADVEYEHPKENRQKIDDKNDNDGLYEKSNEGVKRIRSKRKKVLHRH